MSEEKKEEEQKQEEAPTLEELIKAGDATKVTAFFEEQTKKLVDAAIKSTTEKTSAQLQQEKEQKEAEAAIEKAKKEGNDKEANKLELDALQKLQAKVDAEREEIRKDKELISKQKIIQKYKLPDGYEKRLIGADEKEWEADAKELAKGLPVHKTGEAEGGNKGITATKEQQAKSAMKFLPSQLRTRF